MAKTITAPVEAFVLRTKGRARKRRRARRAGSGEMNTILSAVSDSQEDEEGVSIVCSPNPFQCHEDENDSESADETHHAEDGCNRFPLLDNTPPSTDGPPVPMERMPLGPKPNPRDSQDRPHKRQRLRNPFKASHERDENEPSGSDLDPSSDAEKAVKSTASPPQSSFSFQCAAPSSTAETPTPPSKKRRRRRGRSKGNKSVTSDDSSNNEHLGVELPTANEGFDRRVDVLPTVSELTGKDFDSSALPPIPLASYDEDTDVETQTSIAAERLNQGSKRSPAKVSYASVMASGTTSIVETIAEGPEQVGAADDVEPLLKVDPTKDRPASLPIDKKPMQPAPRNRMSRFFPRQSPSSTSASPIRKHSTTFRHPRFRSKKIGTSPLAPRKTDTATTEAPPAPQDTSLEILSPCPAPSDHAPPSIPSLKSASSFPSPQTPTKLPIPTKPLRTLPWKWWRGTNTPRTSFYASPSSITPYPDELVKPGSLEKLPAKEKPDFVPGLAGEWEFVQMSHLRGGCGEDGGSDEEGEGDMWEEGRGEWVWRCGEGCRCMRRGSYA